ncbi:putative ABC transport system permease protein [Lachnospiraceae bacterium]|nr:putative ABC transport system permease protein [Lachnospiraceae bacterium]
MIENIRLSFQGIFSHKMRSFLTMLGIIIGIAAIIAIVSTIKGTNDEIKNSLVGSGDNIVNVNITQGGMKVNANDGVDLKALPLINEDMLNTIKSYESVQDVAIYHRAATYEGINHSTNQLTGSYIYGCTNDFIKLMNYKVHQGRLFTDADFKEFRKVAILDSTTAYSLFNGENPINKTIEISGNPFVVVGVVEKDDNYQPIINSIDDWYTYYGEESSSTIILPDTIWPIVYSYDEPYQVIVKARSTEDMQDAGKKTQDYLNSFIQKSSNSMEEEDDDESEGEEETVKYKSEDILQKAKNLQELQTSTSTQLIWIASISLLVGGIGVMNIMLVSVTERTKEIGLKKAIGARKGAILGQFLTEASVLTSMGGILGVLTGIALAYFISNVAEVPVAISVPAIMISVVFSMVIGIVFGLIPSIKAANLNPIDALRYE